MLTHLKRDSNNACNRVKKCNNEVLDTEATVSRFIEVVFPRWYWIFHHCTLAASTCIKSIPIYGDDRDPKNWGSNIGTHLFLKGSFLHSAKPLNNISEYKSSWNQHFPLSPTFSVKLPIKRWALPDLKSTDIDISRSITVFDGLSCVISVLCHKVEGPLHCSQMGPYFRDWVPIGTFLTFWVPIGSLFIFHGPYFQCFG